MMRLQFQITRFELTPLKHGQVLKRINENSALRHQHVRFPKHFEEVAYSEYHARRREHKYNRSKVQKYGHQKPNVLSGALREATISRVKLSATQYGWKFTTRGSTQSRLAGWQLRELQAMSAKEKRAEDRQMGRDYKHLATLPEFRRIRKRRTK